MSNYLKYFIMLFLLIVTANARLNSSTNLYLEELRKMNKDPHLSKALWQEFIEKMDKKCEASKKELDCDLYYKFNASLMMFESDDYGDGGQCDRAKANVELFFNNEYLEQQQLVLKIIDKLCTKENLKTTADDTAKSKMDDK